MPNGDREILRYQKSVNPQASSFSDPNHTYQRISRSRKASCARLTMSAERNAADWLPVASLAARRRDKAIMFDGLDMPRTACAAG
jgi:hypothetical protein